MRHRLFPPFGMAWETTRYFHLWHASTLQHGLLFSIFIIIHTYVADAISTRLIYFQAKPHALQRGKTTWARSLAACLSQRRRARYPSMQRAKSGLTITIRRTIRRGATPVTMIFADTIQRHMRRIEIDEWRAIGYDDYFIRARPSYRRFALRRLDFRILTKALNSSPTL